MFKSLKPENDIREQLNISRQQVQVLQKCLADKCDENERIQTKVEILRKSLSQVDYLNSKDFVRQINQLVNAGV